jgi:PTH2 family peptidyl-tRNA hydrolase
MSATADKLRIIIVFRADLPTMHNGKAEVQAGHAVDGTIEAADAADPTLMPRYRADGRVKLSMEVDDLSALLKIKEKAENRGVPHFLVTDAGHTCFAEPTITCIGLGPLTKTDGNALTRGARMRG